MLEVIVEKILAYGELKLALHKEDINYYRNVLLAKFGLEKPYRGFINLSEVASLTNPSSLIRELGEELAKRDNHQTRLNAEAVIIDVLGMMTPIPSIVNYHFDTISKKSSEKAMKYLYDLSIANNYIQQEKIEQNIRWRAPLTENYFEMTINLAKPEKDNKEIAKLLKEPETDKYPSCQLCLENVGFAGNHHTPPRQNLRAVSVSLDKEEWYIQYSPFVYYKDHVIVISKEHKPMTITPRIFSKFIAFVDKFPQFFIGSNSDLPIVGGSILDHEHFQGGAKVMPMFEAKDKYVLKHRDDWKVKVSVLSWDSNVIKIESKLKSALLEKASEISEKWLNYTNEALDIIPFTGETRHAAITPIMIKRKRNYVLYLVLRNNRTNKDYPDGIFHSHPEYHHIKKEGIGLIEQMGTFILPARLKSEFALIEKLYSDKTPQVVMEQEHPSISKHKDFITKLFKDKVKPSDFTTYSRRYMSEVCQEVLKNTACFKNDEVGNKALIDFLKQ